MDFRRCLSVTEVHSDSPHCVVEVDTAQFPKLKSDLKLNVQVCVSVRVCHKSIRTKSGEAQGLGGRQNGDYAAVELKGWRLDDTVPFD